VEVVAIDIFNEEKVVFESDSWNYF
jgi:hypothetical protein